jgi:hypothetical protein
MFTTQNLLPVMGETINVTGSPVAASGFYGSTNGLHTISIAVSNFTGRVSIQASLVTAPGDADWFTVLPADVPYIQYPQRGYVVGPPQTGETSTYTFDFTANVMWVRALVVRSYVIPALATPMFIGTFGLVDSIKMTFGNNYGKKTYSWVAPLQ